MGLPRHFTSQEAHEAGTESTKGFMRFGTLEEHRARSANVAVQPQFVADAVFPLHGNVDEGVALAILPQIGGGFEWTPTVSAQVTPLTLTVNITELQETINSLPKILNANTTINVNPGTYNGDITIRGFSGSGVLTVTSGTSTVSTTHRVTRIVLDKNSLSRINIVGFDALGNSGVCFSMAYQSGPVYFSCCSASAGAASTVGFYGFQAYASRYFYANDCVASNKERGFNIDSGTPASLVRCSGTGNTIGARSTAGSLVYLDSTTN